MFLFICRDSTPQSFLCVEGLEDAEKQIWGHFRKD